MRRADRRWSCSSVDGKDAGGKAKRVVLESYPEERDIEREDDQSHFSRQNSSRSAGGNRDYSYSNEPSPDS